MGHRFLPYLLGLAVSCYGGFSNAPFEPGEGQVIGTLPGPVDTSRAWVAVVGDTDTATTVAEDGSFVLGPVQSGSVEIAASTGVGEAGRMTVDVLSGRTSSVVMVTATAARIEGSLDFTGGPVAARIRVEGLPVAVSAHHHAFGIDGLPAGCFVIHAEADEHMAASDEVCVEAGETVTHPFVLAREHRGEGGQCEACHGGGDCESGLCVGHEVGHGGEHVCTTSCLTDADCGPAFECVTLEDESRACLPAGASCAAVLDLWDGTDCHDAGQCGLGDGHDGAVCDAHRCTVACGPDLECPEGTTCTGHDGHGEAGGTCE